MALTDAKVKVKAAKLPEGKAQGKLIDGGGMYLLINKSGKYWRMDYRFTGKSQRTAYLSLDRGFTYSGHWGY